MERLSEEQKQFYKANGYLIGLPPVFTGKALDELNEGFTKIKGMLKGDENPSDIRMWHRTSRWLYNICVNPQILDYVEDILGPNFFFWSTAFMTKEPYSEQTIGWHQDAYYWPLFPRNTVTVWLAFTDVNEANGAMKVVPGSHKGGVIKHKISGLDSMLSFDLEEGSFREDQAISLMIPAGGLSLHDDAIIHGSPANVSDRWRIGFVIRYSSTDVKWDMSKNPTFQAYLVRGIDEFKHNPQGAIPTEAFARPAVCKRVRIDSRGGFVRA